MHWSKRFTALPAAAAISIGAVAVPALGAGKPAPKPVKWTSRQCSDYVVKVEKDHKKLSKSEIAAANKVLESHSCKERIK